MLGSGTQENPFIVQTPQDLNSIRNNLSAYYELANDIDLSSWGNWTPIANFEGNIDGKGHKIINLTITNGTGDSGFISSTNSSKTFFIRNIGFENVNINATGYRAGGVVGIAWSNGGLIENVYVKGTITTDYYAAGLAGVVRGTTTVRNCWTDVRTHARVYRSAGFVSSTVDSPMIQNCYSLGKATAGNTEYAGFITVVGSSVSISSCYWDIEKSGVTQSTGGTGKTTAEMKQQSTYVGWDFTNIWGINGDYPFLQVFGTPARPPQQVLFTVQSYINPFYSNLSKTTKTTKQTQSFSNAIQTLLERHTATKRISTTFTLPIETSVQKSNRTVRRSIANVNTYINPVASIVERKTKTFKHLLSYVDHIKSNVNIIAPVKNKVVNAYVSIVENPSIVQYEENLSNAYIIENPSFTEVIK